MQTQEGSADANQAAPCPIQHADLAFDPFSHSYLADPYPFFAEARTASPVFYNPDLDYWVVTRYHDIRHIFQTPKLFSAVNALDALKPPCPAAVQRLTEGGFRPIPTLTNTDPPAHTRARRLANVAFTPRRVAAMEPFVRELTVEFISQRLSSGRADLVRDLAWELPARVIFRVLGVPDEDVAQVKAGSESRLLFQFGRPTEAEQAELAQGLATFWRYTEALVARRTAQPQDDFTSDLIQARDGDVPALTAQEVATIVFGLLLAGHETTTNLFGNAFRRLLSQRQAWQTICADQALIPNAIEEVLRFDSSVIAWRRRTTQAVEIGGVLVPAEANLMLLLGAANHDAEVFPEPEVFDIYRPNAKDHLSFGHGPHLCLGAPLSRLEARVVLEELSSRLPSLRIVPDQTFCFLPNFSFRGPRSLLAEWDG